MDHPLNLVADKGLKETLWVFKITVFFFRIKKEIHVKIIYIKELAIRILPLTKLTYQSFRLEKITVMENCVSLRSKVHGIETHSHGLTGH